jgi:hypothetical protein
LNSVARDDRQRAAHMPEGLRYAIEEMTDIKLLVLYLS